MKKGGISTCATFATNFGGYRLSVRRAYAFCNNFSIASPMTRIFAILALIAGEFEEEFAAEGTSHHTVKVFDDKFVAVHFMGNFSLADGPLSAQSAVKGAFPTVFLDYAGVSVRLILGVACVCVILFGGWGGLGWVEGEVLKLRERRIWPAGSRANQASTPSLLMFAAGGG